MIIVIVGPTGVGKSKLAIRLARATGGVIVNGDAYQIYKKMDIGTAKPTLEERKEAEHRLFDYVDPEYEYSIFVYQKTLREEIDKLTKEGRQIIICGGSGLYLKSALYDFTLNENKSDVDMTPFEKYSNEELHAYLSSVDREEAEKIHMNNRKRVMRAIEIYLSEGKKKSEIVSSQEHKPVYDVTFIGLSAPREQLYDVINKRVDKMFEMGLMDEVRSLMKEYPSSLKSLQAIGYKEVIRGIENGLSEEEIKEAVKKNSRNYAKRQFTYFNHQMNVRWFENKDEAFDYALSLTEAK